MGIIPKPFQRPRLEVGVPKVKRTWQDVPVHCLAVDDIVADRGKIVDIQIEFLAFDRPLPGPNRNDVEVQAKITYLSGHTEALVGWLSLPISGNEVGYDGTRVHAYTAGTAELPWPDYLNG